MAILKDKPLSNRTRDEIKKETPIKKKGKESICTYCGHCTLRKRSVLTELGKRLVLVGTK